MKRCLVLIAALGLLVPAFIARAQQDQQPAGSEEKSPPPQLENGTILYLELSKTVDAKKAKVGDQVTAVLLTSVLSHGKVAIRRDSKIIGHVTEARALSKENPESRLGIVFDRIHVKHAQEIPINSVLLAVRPAVRLQTEPPPAVGPRGPNSGSDQSGWPYPTPRSSSPRLHASLGQDFDSPVTSRNQINMQLMEIDGLSLQRLPDGSKVIVSSKKTVKLESRMRLELRIDYRAK